MRGKFVPHVNAAQSSMTASSRRQITRMQLVPAESPKMTKVILARELAERNAPERVSGIVRDVVHEW